MFFLVYTKSKSFTPFLLDQKAHFAHLYAKYPAFYIPDHEKVSNGLPIQW